jgi:LacI family transcriptional regulator
MAVTVHDVAKKAGVAVGTVSRYLNGFQLREKNRLKVEQAIAELDFKENIIAKGLRRNRSMTIGVIIPQYLAVFFMAVTTILERLLEKENYSLLLCNYENNQHKLLEKLRFAKNRFVDGLIFFPSFADAESIPLLEEFAAEKTPVVFIDQLLPGFETDAVIVDNAQASFRAVEKLIRDHHTQIAIVNGYQDVYVYRERLRGYYDAMRIYNLPVDKQWVKAANFIEAGEYAIIESLFSLPNPPTAIYATNYHATIGTVLALHDLHLKIPEDVSLIGFDRFDPMDVIEPPLTLVEQPIERMAQTAAHLLLQRIKGDYKDFPQTITLNTKMLIRDSVRTLP